MYTQTLQNFSVALKLRLPLPEFILVFPFIFKFINLTGIYITKALNYTETASGRPSFLRATRGERRVLLL